MRSSVRPRDVWNHIPSATGFFLDDNVAAAIRWAAAGNSCAPGSSSALKAGWLMRRTATVVLQSGAWQAAAVPHRSPASTQAMSVSPAA